jgi:hypothetical protein
VKIHILKLWTKYWDDVESGRKNFEVRLNDRDYRKGDVLQLMEWDPETKKFTGREIARRVKYILHGGGDGDAVPIHENYCIMGLERVPVLREGADLVSLTVRVESLWATAMFPPSPRIRAHLRVRIGDVDELCEQLEFLKQRIKGETNGNVEGQAEEAHSH